MLNRQKLEMRLGEGVENKVIIGEVEMRGSEREQQYLEKWDIN
jgi:hypothetical protein